MPDPRFRSTLDARVAELLEDSKTLERRTDAAISPADAAQRADGHAALSRLRELSSRGTGLSVGRTLGEGGMGIVRVGTQEALGREVAVKTLRGAAPDEDAMLVLLREAWATGALEHPNVVPIYDISLDARGCPQIVLKKIAGSSWAELMHDEERVRERFKARELLDWNLRILVQVASAVHFAHARGILHRDLKPENVMIGEFGEVYVVDWGIAVSLRDDGSGRLPLAADAVEMAGTPSYMAPEMLGGQPGQLSPRTDVYLLGATLYELLTGKPPHAGTNMLEVISQIARSLPPLPEDTSDELARIVRRAMSVDPADRFASAEELSLALGDFLEHRGSMKLAREAEARLSDLERERAAEKLDADEERLRLYHLFGECRFGFLQSLRLWPENHEAQAGLSRAIATMIELELELGDPRAAALLLTELAEPPVELVARVDAARKQREAEEAHRAALARDLDPSIGRRTRVFLGVVVGVVWTIFPWVAWSYERTHRGAVNHRMAATASFAMLAGATVLWLWGRESMSRTSINRSLVHAVGIALGGQVAMFMAAWVVGIDYEQTLALLALHYALVCTQTAAIVERGLWPSALSFWLVFALTCARPHYAYVLQSVGNFALTLNIVVSWGRIRDDVVTPLRERQEARRQRWRAFLERATASSTDTSGDRS